LFKLMAYKDEYEVARLYTDGSFAREVAKRFAGDYTLKFHLAPPVLAKPDPKTGVAKKNVYGPWMLGAMRVLARLKGLRGTAFDPFGRTAERRTERRLISDYEAMLAELAGALSKDNVAIAAELAGLPEKVRGYGHIKEAAVKAYEQQRAGLLEAFRAGRGKLARAAE
jgi:indolepyruvate ferredoxin oxidoreductase